MNETDFTARLSSALAGRYKIQRKLGEGGMASVYLAEDIKHSRKVALKILRPELAAVIGAERFLSEIKTTANLQHPHILPLFDSGESEGFLYYVMPFIDGETLRERIEREQQLGVEESVRIARDVADALDYAHRNDVIHRDIKPANILLHDGRPVVADFGIALAISAAGAGRMTETGLSLGTPHYMSPEQASADRDLSARSDVYSLGCVLYEMLAGQPPHTGPSAQSILVRILTEDPRPVTDLRQTVPPHVAAVVTKAIEKLPADRFESARAFLDALEDPSFTYVHRPSVATAATMAPAAPASEGPRRSSRLLPAAVVVLGATTLLFGQMALRSGGESTAASGAVLAFEMPEGTFPNTEYPPTVGPDGSVVIRTAQGLLLRMPGSTDFTPLEGTVGASGSTFSPDGAWLAFLQADPNGALSLRRMPAGGGPVSTLWEPGTGDPFAAATIPSWGNDGWIYFGTSDDLLRVPAEGGAADTLATFSGFRATHVDALPGGNGVLLTIGQGLVTLSNRVLLYDLAARDTSTLIPDGFDAQWVSTGHLIYAHPGGALYAMPFDHESLEATGSGVPVIDNASVAGRLWGRFAVSPTGTLAFARGDVVAGATGEVSFAFVDLDGSVEMLPLQETDHGDASLSPDGLKIAYVRNDHIWIYDTDRGTNRQLTEEGADHHNPIWSPDGTEVLFRSLREGPTADLWLRPADGSEPARRVAGSEYSDNPMQWLEDGTVLFDTEGDATDILRLNTEDETVEVLLQADWAELAPQVSPDGRWMAYLSSENDDALHLYVRRWPDLTDKVQVTTGDRSVRGNSVIVWSADSRTVYYQHINRVWAANLVDPEGPVFEVEDLDLDARGSVWDMHNSGRLLVQTSRQAVETGDEEFVEPRLVIVANWLTALRQRLGESQ
jgi:serine/threonine-protein kinase